MLYLRINLKSQHFLSGIMERKTTAGIIDNTNKFFLYWQRKFPDDVDAITHVHNKNIPAIT